MNRRTFAMLICLLNLLCVDGYWNNAQAAAIPVSPIGRAIAKAWRDVAKALTPEDQFRHHSYTIDEFGSTLESHDWGKNSIGRNARLVWDPKRNSWNWGAMSFENKFRLVEEVWNTEVAKNALKTQSGLKQVREFVAQRRIDVQNKNRWTLKSENGDKLSLQFFATDEQEPTIVRRCKPMSQICLSTESASFQLECNGLVVTITTEGEFNWTAQHGNISVTN